MKTHHHMYKQIVIDISREIMTDLQCVLGRLLNPDTVQLLLSGCNMTWYGPPMGRLQLIAWSDSVGELVYGV